MANAQSRRHRPDDGCCPDAKFDRRGSLSAWPGASALFGVTVDNPSDHKASDQSGVETSVPLRRKTLTHLLIGPARDVRDPQVFHSLSLVAFLAWVGLGSDGLSSSCYGPEE